MGLYNFQSRFVPFILDGRKMHTIRATRAHPDKPGNTLHLYSGLRQKGARLLMRVPCVKVEEIEIMHRIERFKNPDNGKIERVEWFSIWIDDQELSGSENEELARRDGFSDFQEMMKFWDGRLPFEGQIIHWRIPR